VRRFLIVETEADPGHLTVAEGVLWSVGTISVCCATGPDRGRLFAHGSMEDVFVHHVAGRPRRIVLRDVRLRTAIVRQDDVPRGPWALERIPARHDGVALPRWLDVQADLYDAARAEALALFPWLAEVPYRVPSG
jgi:hypothetical protein